ncbi:MAG TPA: allophanate hydrolase subunit 1, partial [Verrucomicrobiae bacterium]|nr:allophanate hydrolase subunit 1 [Verrucomicrobiae bacterium]
ADNLAAMLKLLPCGPNALMIQFAEAPGQAAFGIQQRLIAELQRQPPTGLVEYIPAFTTLLLEFDPRHANDLNALASSLLPALEQAAKETSELPAPPVAVIDVVYDGPDLQRVADHNHLSPAQVIELHAAPVYTVYQLGFMPGFPYLGDLNPLLRTPRLESPRTRVGAGSVAIGGEHTGIYSIDSPGGWNIVGRVSVKMFDPRRGTAGQEAGMFHLHAGDRVKFNPVPLP